jgi:hypothetical protein
MMVAPCCLFQTGHHSGTALVASLPPPCISQKCFLLFFPFTSAVLLHASRRTQYWQEIPLCVYAIEKTPTNVNMTSSCSSRFYPIFFVVCVAIHYWRFQYETNGDERSKEMTFPTAPFLGHLAVHSVAFTHGFLPESNSIRGSYLPDLWLTSSPALIFATSEKDAVGPRYSPCTIHLYTIHRLPAFSHPL